MTGASRTRPADSGRRNLWLGLIALALFGAAGGAFYWQTRGVEPASDVRAHADAVAESMNSQPAPPPPAEPAQRAPRRGTVPVK